MTNLADFIERFIQQKLSEGAADHVLVRRNELADELSCAPSQISYVLSTRFTLDRGYLVESRRGAGGFVRIARLEPAQLTFAAHVSAPQASTSAQTVQQQTPQTQAEKRSQTTRQENERRSAGEDETQLTVPELIDRLAAAQMFTRRETIMLQHLFSVLDHFLDEEGQRAVFRQTVHELLAHS